jgi:hypothetical protein
LLFSTTGDNDLFTFRCPLHKLRKLLLGFEKSDGLDDEPPGQLTGPLDDFTIHTAKSEARSLPRVTFSLGVSAPDSVRRVLRTEYLRLGAHGAWGPPWTSTLSGQDSRKMASSCFCQTLIEMVLEIATALPGNVQPCWSERSISRAFRYAGVHPYRRRP